MARDRSVIQRVGDWKLAFDAIREEITPPKMREVLATFETVPDGQTLIAYAGLARIVTANDRSAAVVAAMLTQSGVTRPVFDDAEAGDVG